MDRLSDGTPLRRLDLWDMDGEWGVEVDTDAGEWVPEDLAGDVVIAYTKYVAACRELRRMAERVYLWRRGRDDGEEMLSREQQEAVNTVSAVALYEDEDYHAHLDCTVCGCAVCAGFREGVVE